MARRTPWPIVGRKARSDPESFATCTFRRVNIAAVSRVSLSTKLPGATAGFRLTVEAGVET